MPLCNTTKVTSHHPWPYTLTKNSSVATGYAIWNFVLIATCFNEVTE